MAGKQILEARQGKDFFQFYRQLRQDLDEPLANLNIKKADKETITALLANLGLYTRCSEQNGWPKKMKRKSYFLQGLQFYRIYNEAIGGERIDDLQLPRQDRPQRRVRPRRPRSKVPAFAGKSKGGIFGLKK